MTGFDVRLAARLSRLEAAIPVPPSPVVVPLRARRRWGIRRIGLLAAVIALLGLAGAVGANRMLYPDVTNRDVEAAIHEAGLDVTACISAGDATARLRSSLAAHGVGSWMIEVRPGTSNGPCLWAGQVPTLHVVALFPALGEQGVAAMGAAADELFAHCYGRADAIALFSQASRSIGVTRFEVSADPWGPQGGPTDRVAEYEAHVAAGCFVYVGLGWKADGTVVYYLWGPWP